MRLRKELFSGTLIFGLILLINVVHTAKLADSGYPMAGANPQRNYQFNRKVLCPSASGGKSTILNTAWKWPPASFPMIWDSIGIREITLDDNGYIYLTGYVQSEGVIPVVVKIHISGNDTLTVIEYSDPLQQSVYTHLEGGVYYSVNNNATYQWNATDLQLLNTIENFVSSSGESSVAPLGSNYLVKSNPVIAESDLALTFIKVPENTVDTTANTNFVVGYTTPVMIYKNSTHEFPIVVANGQAYASKYYSKVMSRESAKAMIDGDEIISITSTSDPKIFRISAATGAVLEEKSVSTVGGDSILLQDTTKFLFHNGKSFIDVTNGDTHAFADVYNGKYILYQTPPMNVQPTLSIADNVVLATVPRGTAVEVWGLDWTTSDIKMKAVVPDASDVYSAGMPIFSEDCKMHIVVDQSLYTLEPLPIQNVVPILECIDPSSFVAYFSYDNLGQREFHIPAIFDRNFVAAVNDTPITSFKVGRGPTFPLSAVMYISLTDGAYTWQLENYQLTFDPADTKLFCPTTVTLVIGLSADEPFPQGFSENVRAAFVAITGVSSSRVTVVAKKRSVTQSNDLETELAVAPDSTGEEGPASYVVQNFITNQQDQFAQEVSVSEGAPANITVTSVTTKELTNAVRGSPEIVPVSVPISASNEPQASENPQTVPSSANSNVGFVMGSGILIFLFC